MHGGSLWGGECILCHDCANDCLLYTLGEMYQTLHLTVAHFILCKLQFTKLTKRKKKKTIILRVDRYEHPWILFSHKLTFIYSFFSPSLIQTQNVRCPISYLRLNSVSWLHFTSTILFLSVFSSILSPHSFYPLRSLLLLPQHLNMMEQNQKFQLTIVSALFLSCSQSILV